MDTICDTSEDRTSTSTPRTSTWSDTIIIDTGLEDPVQHSPSTSTHIRYNTLWVRVLAFNRRTRPSTCMSTRTSTRSTFEYEANSTEGYNWRVDEYYTVLEGSLAFFRILFWRDDTTQQDISVIVLESFLFDTTALHSFFPHILSSWWLLLWQRTPYPRMKTANWRNWLMFMHIHAITPLLLNWMYKRSQSMTWSVVLTALRAWAYTGGPLFHLCR